MRPNLSLRTFATAVEWYTEYHSEVSLLRRVDWDAVRNLTDELDGVRPPKRKKDAPATRLVLTMKTIPVLSSLPDTLSPLVRDNYMFANMKREEAGFDPRDHITVTGIGFTPSGPIINFHGNVGQGLFQCIITPTSISYYERGANGVMMAQRVTATLPLAPAFVTQQDRTFPLCALDTYMLTLSIP